MEITLCYKPYTFKMTPGACKSFTDHTGEDLQNMLMRYIKACNDTRDTEYEKFDIATRMIALQEVCLQRVAARVIHCLIRADEQNASIPLKEIEDGMFRVGWLPIKGDEMDDGADRQPWPLVMLDIASQVNEYYTKNVPQKKK